MNKNEAIKNIKHNLKGFIAVDFREGEQFSGKLDQEKDIFTNFDISVPQAIKTIDYLTNIGIEYTEVPNASVPGIEDFIRSLVAVPSRPKLLSHIRNNIKDVNAAISLGVDGVNILTNVDPERIKKSGFNTLDSYMNTLGQVVQTAKKAGLETRVSVEHLWNGFFDEALNVFEFADALGVKRVGLADTLGIASRFDVEERVVETRRRVKNADIEVHFHADGFQQVSNVIEALIYGANFPNISFAGRGERTGITPSSGILTALKMFDPDIVKNYHMEFLTPAEQFVMNMHDLSVPHNLITSDNAFAHKAGIHTNGIANHSTGVNLYQPFPAEEVGNTTRIITDSKISGRTPPDMLRAVVPGARIQ